MIRKNKEKRIYSPNKQKALLVLLGGISLGLARSPYRQGWIFKNLSNAWKDIDKQYLYKIIREFKHDRLVRWEEDKSGDIKIILTEKGKKWALKFNIDKMQIKKPEVWDKKWRVVFYDIPEKNKAGREALRKKLKEMGFCELQKSVFAYPFPCKNEIDFIAEFFKIRNYLRYAEMTNLSNEASLLVRFGLH